MSRITALVRLYLADDNGATVVEYALIAGIVSMAAVAGATQIGQFVAGVFTTLTNAIVPP